MTGVALFGGVYAWSAAILAAGTAGLLLWTRPRLGDGWTAALDFSLLSIVAVLLLQLTPLPLPLVRVISPSRVAYLEAAALRPFDAGFLTLTVNPGATAHALLAAFCAFGTFWVARAVFERGGIRLVLTGLSWASVALVLAATVQASSGTPLVYGFWQPYDGGARPLGPFINRNHLGTWALLALFLCAGGFGWRRAALPPPHGWTWRARLAEALDGRTIVLLLATVLLTLVIAVGASRSTIVALACGAACAAAIMPRRAWRPSGWSSLAAVAVILMVTAYADTDRLLSRIDETRQAGLSGRMPIWQDTTRLLRDFPATGVGGGGFSDAMRLYQTSDRAYFWNEAHNHYLQVSAEGGLLLALPSALALLALTILARRVLRTPATPLLWIRAGAAAGLVAVAVQSLWETGLTLPASGMLAGVAAAILVHDSVLRTRRS